MLIFSRKIGQQIAIGQEVLIRVLGVSGNRVCLGITAPEAVPVHREKVRQRIHRGAEGPDSSGDASEYQRMTDDAA